MNKTPEEKKLDNTFDEGASGNEPVQTPPESKKPVENKKGGEEMVSLPKEKLEQLFATLQKQSEQIGILFDAADKNRLARAQANENGEPLIKTVKVSKWQDNGKYILGWKLTKNVSEIIAGRWVEDQKTMLVFDDGSNVEVSLLDFYRKIEKEKAEILGRNKKQDSKGIITEILSLQFNDGKQIEIDLKYVN